MIKYIFTDNLKEDITPEKFDNETVNNELFTRIYKSFKWLRSCDFKNMSANIDEQEGKTFLVVNNVDWKSGTWENGIWSNGLWRSGIWKDGIWYNGTWKSGEFQSGIWYNGTWENGKFINGTWKLGTWLKGTWYNGTWQDGIWNGGTWKRGLIYSKKFKKSILSEINPNDFIKIEKDSDTIDEFIEKLEK